MHSVKNAYKLFPSQCFGFGTSFMATGLADGGETHPTLLATPCLGQQCALVGARFTERTTDGKDRGSQPLAAAGSSCFLHLDMGWSQPSQEMLVGQSFEKFFEFARWIHLGVRL